ncbi:hypothetical protein [Methylovulum psychrotolerans]|nr:hypothetical protein [Methylovulum psychrotolerans]
MRVKFRSVAITFLLLLGGMVIALPWVAYWSILAGIQGRPTAPAKTMTQAEINAIWLTEEPDLPMAQLDDITPYWIYDLLLCGVYSGRCDEDGLKHQMSLMAVRVSRRYLSHEGFGNRRVSMLKWHTGNVSLTIWLQRNKSPAELISLYYGR